MTRGLGNGNKRQIMHSQAALLGALRDGEWHRFGEIVKSSQKSEATVSKYLKEFTDRGLVQRKKDRESGEYPCPVYYRLTEDGRKALKEREIIEKLVERRGEYLEAELEHTILEIVFGGKGSFEGFLPIESWYDLQPEGKVLADAIVLLEEQSPEKANSVIEELKKSGIIKHLATLFVEMFKEAVIDAYGARAQFREGKSPLQMRDLVEQEKVGLDYDATLMLHFNGKEVAKSVNWREYEKAFEKGDRLLREGWELFAEDVAEPSARRNWITDTLIDELRREQTELEKFLGKVFPNERKEIVANPWKMLDTPARLKEKVAERHASPVMEGEMFALARPDRPIEDVEEALEELLKESIVEIVPVFLFKLSKRKANKKQWKAKSGYFSPYALITRRAFQL